MVRMNWKAVKKSNWQADGRLREGYEKAGNNNNAHCCHCGQAFNSQYCVLAHNGDDSTGSGGGPPIFRFELCSLLCDFD